MRNENLHSQQLLYEFRAQTERTVRERDNAQGEQDMAILAYNNEKKNPAVGISHIGIRIGMLVNCYENILLSDY